MPVTEAANLLCLNDIQIVKLLIMVRRVSISGPHDIPDPESGWFAMAATQELPGRETSPAFFMGECFLGW